MIAHNYFPQAMALLRQDPVASDRLGKPIYNKHIALLDSWNSVQHKYAQVSGQITVFEIPIVSITKK